MYICYKFSDSYVHRHIFDLLFVSLLISYFKALEHMLCYQFLAFRLLIRGIYFKQEYFIW